MLYMSFAEEEVTGGDAKLSVKLDGFPVFNKDMRLCDLLSQERVSCPVKPFSGFNSTTVTLPDVGVSEWIVSLIKLGLLVD